MGRALWRCYTRCVNGTAKDPVELIREIKQGLNVEANFHWLFERHYAQILRFFRRKGFDPEDCRDLTQETFISVYKGLRDLRQEEQFESWLFAIAHNVWCSWIESRTAQKRSATVMSLEAGGETDDRLPLADRVVDGSADPLTLVLEKEKVEQFRDALEHLPQQMHRCAHLRVVHDLSYAEIAALMDISVNTVKAHLHQAQKALRAQLSSYFDEMKV
ncbi:MAG: polymerase sigma factor RpoE [Acidobacteria bacterium]|nr:polymerase sigma factor RpoE [Acidobacteriota bacterium]